MFSNWICPKYGWRGHWFKNSRCACNLTKFDYDKSKLINEITKEKNPLLSIIPYIAGIVCVFTLFIITIPIYTSLFESSTTNNTSEEIGESSPFPPWAIFLGIPFAVLIILKLIRTGRYD